MNCPSCGHENIEGNDRCENCLAPFRDLDVPRVDSAEGLARSVMESNLGELDKDEVICVTPDTPALEVARLMKNSNCGCALVVDSGKLVGIFTEHDVLLQMFRALQPGQSAWDPAQERSGKPQFVEPTIRETVAQEASVDVGRPNSELGNDARHPNETAVKHLMTTNPEALHETDSVAEAFNRMSLGRYRHLPFVKSDGTYGVASIKSLLKYIAQEDW